MLQVNVAQTFKKQSALNSITTEMNRVGYGFDGLGLFRFFLSIPVIIDSRFHFFEGWS